MTPATTFTLDEIDAAIRSQFYCPHDDPQEHADCLWNKHAEGIVKETHDRLLNRDPDDENEPDVPTAPAEVARLRAVEGAVQALHDRLSRERPYSLGSGYVDLLREALAAKDVTL